MSFQFVAFPQTGGNTAEILLLRHRTLTGGSGVHYASVTQFNFTTEPIPTRKMFTEPLIKFLYNVGCIPVAK